MAIVWDAATGNYKDDPSSNTPAWLNGVFNTPAAATAPTTSAAPGTGVIPTNPDAFKSKPTIDPTIAALQKQIDDLKAKNQSTVMPAVDWSKLFGNSTDQNVGFGFPLVQATTQMIIAANAEKRAQAQQAIDLQRTISDLSRVSPTRAAAFATGLGLPNPVDLSFANVFASGAVPAIAGGAGYTGNIGGQQLSLPGTLSGHQLDFLGKNPNVANIISDIADALGAPDFLKRSLGVLTPTSSSLLGMAA